jgi:hypothetical protein
MVPGMVKAKERDRVFQRDRRYRLKGTHTLRVWEDGSVATLDLGSRPRQRGCKGAGQREAHESHQGLPGV